MASVRRGYRCRVADDDYAETPAGEFPPGLESLSAEIQRAANSRQRGEDTSREVDRLTDEAVAFLSDARRTLSQARGDTDALGGRMREALTGVKSQVAVALSGTGSLRIGGMVFGASALSGQGTLSASAIVLSDIGAAVESLDVRKDPTVLDRLPAAYVFYIILVWLLAVGVGVVLKNFKLPPDVVEQLQTDPNYVSLALDLTIFLLAVGRRK